MVPDIRVVGRVLVGDALDLLWGEGDVNRVRRSVIIHFVCRLDDNTVMAAFLCPAFQVAVPNIRLTDCAAPAIVLDDVNRGSFTKIKVAEPKAGKKQQIFAHNSKQIKK